jgi:sodium transport system permease protein
MNIISTVIKKELKDTLRDKRTLVSAIIIPAIIIPVIMLGVTKLQSNLMSKEENKKLNIVLVGIPDTLKVFFEDENFALSSSINLEDGKKAISKDSLDAVIEFLPEFQSNIDLMKSGTINVYYKSTNLMVFNRVNDKIQHLKSHILKSRTIKLNIPPDAFSPIHIGKMDIASSKEQFGKLAGGFLPYIFIIFCFMGCMYPAIELFTGEKEKGTMETLLTVPASRFKILIGKITATSIIGLSATLMTIVGMIFSLKIMTGIPKEFLDSINDILNMKFIVMLFAMIIPLSIFFAGILSSLVIRTRSFKEAQSIVTPLTFIVIIPAIIALLPGVELNWKTVWIPILNIALATKEIIAGTIIISQYIVLVSSLVLLALLAAWTSLKQFSNETMVLK